MTYMSDDYMSDNYNVARESRRDNLGHSLARLRRKCDSEGRLDIETAVYWLRSWMSEAARCDDQQEAATIDATLDVIVRAVQPVLHESIRPYLLALVSAVEIMIEEGERN